MVLHPQAEAAMALWAQGPRVSDPGFDVDAQRRLAREQAAAEPREDVARAEDVDADGVPAGSTSRPRRERDHRGHRGRVPARRRVRVR